MITDEKLRKNINPGVLTAFISDAERCKRLGLATFATTAEIAIALGLELQSHRTAVPALCAEVERLREALRPFADAWRDDISKCDCGGDGHAVRFDAEVWKAADAALARSALQDE